PLGFAREPADAEIEHQGVAPHACLGDHYVLRLQVAVDYAVSVRAADRVEHLPHQMHRFGYAELAFGREQALESRPGHELEGGIELPIARLARIDEPHDVGMQQLGAQLRFTAEALDVAL